MVNPKAFISYSWTSPGYREEVLMIADELLKAGIDVIIDEYDLSEGQDVVAFMERLKTDESLNFCLVLSDAAYAKKADERKKGVGTEAQVISKQVYDSVDQTKFIPVVMENDETGNPCLPTFLQSRKYIDFSSPERKNQNWERLVRLLHGKPERVKPEIGPAPSFLNDAVAASFSSLRASFQLLRGGLLDGKPGVAVLRDEMAEAFWRELQAAAAKIGEGGTEEETLAAWNELLRFQVQGRDTLVDWMLIEAKIDPLTAVNRCIVPLLERVVSFIREADDSQVPIFADTLAILGYELPLYSIACLIEVDAPEAIRTLFEHPFTKRRGSHKNPCAIGLGGFRHYSRVADSWNETLEKRWLSPVAEKLRERATHGRISFQKLIEAEALTLVFNIVRDANWYPSTAAYAENGPHFPWFQKARLGRNPDRLATAIGRTEWQGVRDEFTSKFQRALSGSHWPVFQWGGEDYLEAMGFRD